MAWRAAVIGLGKIGMGFDYNDSDNAVTLTHASAYHKHPKFNLVAGVDKEPKKRRAFKSKYNSPAYSTIKELFQHQQPEVVSICVPTERHFQVFNELISYCPLAIVCEKPFSDSSNTAKSMIRQAQSAACILAVNYMRRLEPGVVRLKKTIDSGKIGKIYKGVVWYSKGLINNGSHYIDLMIYFLGEVVDVKVINKGRNWGDKDSEPDFVLYFKEAAVYFLAAKEEHFTFLNVELIGSKGKIQYIDIAGGNSIRYWLSQKDRVYSGYTFLKDEPCLIKNDLNNYQWYVMNEIASYLAGKTKALSSSGETALKTLRVIEKITNRPRSEE